jgi:hypothetical protein
MGATKQAILEEMDRQAQLCRRCKKRPKTHRCSCCDEVTLCAQCACDLYGPMCPDCEETFTGLRAATAG